MMPSEGHAVLVILTGAELCNHQKHSGIKRPRRPARPWIIHTASRSPLLPSTPHPLLSGEHNRAGKLASEICKKTFLQITLLGREEIVDNYMMLRIIILSG